MLTSLKDAPPHEQVVFISVKQVSYDKYVHLRVC